MTEILRQPLKTQAAVSSRIKVMAKLDIAEKRLPQDGRIKIKTGRKRYRHQTFYCPHSKWRENRYEGS